MVDQVFRIGDLRDRVLALLHKQSTPMTAGAIARELGLPIWAVEAGLDAAFTGDLLSFNASGFYVPKVHLAVVNKALETTN